MRTREKDQGAIHSALLELQGLSQQAQAMGNNDFESGDITRLIQLVETGHMPPSEALQRARQIIDAKQR